MRLPCLGRLDRLDPIRSSPLGQAQRRELISSAPLRFDLPEDVALLPKSSNRSATWTVSFPHSTECPPNAATASSTSKWLDFLCNQEPSLQCEHNVEPFSDLPEGGRATRFLAGEPKVQYSGSRKSGVHACYSGHLQR